jgi:transposase
MNITRVGIDLAKTVFQVHGVDERGKTVLRKQLKRAQLLEFFANLRGCVIGMEACGSAHYWARKLSSLGHVVKLLAPKLVKPYVKSNKNDRNDAEAICEALGRPNMRFVPIKNPEQQALLALHRVREGLVAARTAQVNQIRGLLAEFGLVMPKGVAKMRTRVPEILEDGANELPGLMRELLARCYEQFQRLDAQVHELEARIVHWHRDNEASQRLAEVPGVGPITATAYVATVGDGQAFKSGRQAAAWLGIVPKQRGTGGKQQLLGISKRGDVYLRKLLIHGARAVLRQLKPEHTDSWLGKLASRRHCNVAAVALANKNARIMWALLAHGREYRHDYIPARP